MTPEPPRPSRIMSGNSILRDGRSVNENYGTDLDKLEEGDRVGVVRTSNGDLVFFVNGVRDRVQRTSKNFSGLRTSPLLLPAFVRFLSADSYGS